MRAAVLFILTCCLCAPGWSYFEPIGGPQKIGLTKPLELNLNPGDEIGAGKMSFTMSIPCPGLGLYAATGNKMNLLLMPACYGLVGGGIGISILGKIEYKKYLETKDPTKIDVYEKKAAQYATSGFMMSAVGIGLWVFQVGWTYIYGSYNDIYRHRNKNWNDKVSFHNTGFDPYTKTVALGATIKI
jgi:hypothetical protein